MTLPSSGNNPPISLSDLNTEFGRGYSLSGYQNTRWFKDDNSRGYFAAGSITLSDFYATRVSSPVVSGSVTLDRATYNGKNYAFPMFNNLTVTAYSGKGGTAGKDGNCATATVGGTGGASSFSTSAVTAAGANGPYGGAGSVSTATASWSITDANQATIIGLYGSLNPLVIGAAGAAGTHGLYQTTHTQCYQYAYYYGVPVCTAAFAYNVCDGNAGDGAVGVDGYIVVSWS